MIAFKTIFITVFVLVLKSFSPVHCSCNTSPSSKTFEVNGKIINGESIYVGLPLKYKRSKHKITKLTKD